MASTAPRLARMYNPYAGLTITIDIYAITHYTHVIKELEGDNSIEVSPTFRSPIFLCVLALQPAVSYSDSNAPIAIKTVCTCLYHQYARSLEM